MTLGWTVPWLAWSAVALVPPAPATNPSPTLEIVVGPPAIVPSPGDPRTPVTRPPDGLKHGWSQFVRDQPGAWRALWDPVRGIPWQVYGSGIPVPGASQSGARAVTLTRAIVARHLSLLAPGARMTDFVVVANTFDSTSQLRTLGFIQHYRGLRVRGGALSVRIKNDRLFVLASQAYPHLNVIIPAAPISSTAARQAAMTWLQTSFPRTSVELYAEPTEPIILAWASSDGVTARVVREVVIDVAQPVGRWSVFIDADTGNPVAREQTLRFADGTLAIRAPVRHPGRPRREWPAPFVEVTIDGETRQTDALGRVSWPGQDDATFRATPWGSAVHVTNARGARASAEGNLANGGAFVWSADDDEFADAQLTTFVAASTAKARAQAIAPDMAWLQEPVVATVNLADTCNAFSDGTTINFFSAGERCQNTGRIPDVVYHEFGHSFHAHAIIPGVGAFDAALSEGASDYLAATITEDPGTARGFFYSDRPLRHLDPDNEEYVWPTDISNDPHLTGLIFAGAMWDLRTLLANQSALPEHGVRIADHLWHQALQRSANIPSTYVEILAADDDDGNLANGTPHFCEIVDAFARHGLADINPAQTLFTAPSRSGSRLTVELNPHRASCREATATAARVVWRVRDEPNHPEGTIALEPIANGFAGDLPSEPTERVLWYRVEIDLSDGSQARFPVNPAAPWYELYLGPIVPLYCTDFETDPDEDGWFHQLLAGEDRAGADDWQWSSLVDTPGSGDPPGAFSGSRVYGNDLGGGMYNGRYQPNRQNMLTMPTVSAQGFSVVRLQYRRWLTVEDGDFDQAEILSNGIRAWANFASGHRGNSHHEDRQWRFHDVDLTPTIRDGVVQVAFRLTTDGGLEFGGWTLDDLCIVGVEPETPLPCAEGARDDGNSCPGEDVVPPQPDRCVGDPGACPDRPAILNARDGGGCGCSSATGSRFPPGAWLIGLIWVVGMRRSRRNSTT